MNKCASKEINCKGAQTNNQNNKRVGKKKRSADIQRNCKRG